LRGTRRDVLKGVIAAAALPGRAATAAETAVPASVAAFPIDAGRHFKERGLVGTFVLLSVQDDTLLLHNPGRADTPYLPCSTFKIPNALISLETGVVRDEDEVLKWDGVERPVAAWNKDHSMRTGIAASAVWFYQEMARRIGEKRMREWVDRLGYGNRDIGGGIDQFWLTGALRTTAREQVDFVRRLYADELPFSERSRRIVKDILILEKPDASAKRTVNDSEEGFARRAEDGYVLRGKTGLSGRPGIGWFVGWLERGPRAFVFALNVDMKADTDIGVRKEIAVAVLRDLGLLAKG
jgi:beta-lactamase class D